MSGNGTLSPAAGTLPIKERLMKLIIAEAREKLKMSFYFDYIPGRTAELLLALHEKKKLTGAEMESAAGASRNSVMRSVSILKKLGLMKFHGRGHTGYYSLTDEGEKAML